MKAIRKLTPTPGFVLTDYDIPKIGDFDLLIQVKASAICGTDIHIYKWNDWANRAVKVPVTVGHEFSGVVVEVGKNVKNFVVGDRVSAEGHIVCNNCFNCRTNLKHLCPSTIGIGIQRDGCFAEYISVPESNAVLLPSDISDEIGALLDPLGNAVHASFAFDLCGQDVLVVGAGPIGLMSCRIARYVGARRVVLVERSNSRLELASKLLANDQIEIINSEEAVNNLSMDFGVGLEMSGSMDGLKLIIKSLRPGGSISLLGSIVSDAGIDWYSVIFKGLTIKGIYGRRMFDTWYKMIALIQSGLNIENIITKRLHFKDFNVGFESLLNGVDAKIILHW